MGIENNPKFLEPLKKDEGEVRDKTTNKHKAYKCKANKGTIGWGHNYQDNKTVGLNDNSMITNEEAEKLLISDLKKFVDGLNKNLPWWTTLTPPRQAVLLNMAFNMGIKGLLTFKNTLRLIEAGDYFKAAENMLLSKWKTDVGNRAVRLAKQMATGEWQ